jgi:aspartate kinase
VAKIVVQKFGGTSVQDADAMRRVMDIVKTHGIKRGLRPLVVLSACAGVTNALIRVSELAILGKIAEAQKEVAQLEARHFRIVQDLKLELRNEQETLLALRLLWRDLRTIIRGVELLGEMTPKMKDKVVSCGELASTTIFAHAFRDYLKNQSVLFLDAREFFITDSNFTLARPNVASTKKKIRSLARKISDGAVGITQGFVGANERGETTTIGRGGSDFSASIMGVAADASEIQIWTDVAGIYTCDHRIVPEAYAQDSVSFNDASVMAHYGAKVLHPETIWPAVEAGIPVRVLSSKEPKRTGTTIVSSSLGTPPITGIAVTKNILLASITSRFPIPQPSVASSVFSALEKKGIIPLASSISFDNIALAFDGKTSLSEVRTVIERYATVELTSDMSLITLVGHGLTDSKGVAAKLFSAIKKIHCSLISYGGLGNAVSIVVSGENTNTAVKAVHKAFF